jgi:hypothetical protein
MIEPLIRFLIGGTVVSGFALLGDSIRPKSFAGVFGAAPSVALATLALSVHADGASYASTEARSMVIGAAALLIYLLISRQVLWRRSIPVAAVTVGGLVLWLALALVGWLLILRGAGM